jgi:hypothetical protein
MQLFQREPAASQENCDPFHHIQRACPVAQKTARNECLLLHVGFFQREIQFANKKEREEFKGGVCSTMIS